MPQRRRWLALLAAAVVAACAAPQPEVKLAPGATTYPPTLNVDLLEAPPSRAYTEIGVIDAPGEPGALRAQVLAQIRDKARALGADAVILTDQSRRAPTSQQLNPTTGNYETVGGQLIPAYKALAIKYR
jgi:hypothetical protein